MALSYIDRWDLSSDLAIAVQIQIPLAAYFSSK